MNEISYLIYLIVFVIGLIAGLVLSYRKHGEPFIIEKIEPISLAIAIIGCFLVLNASILSTAFLPHLILVSLGLLLAGLILGMRPGYGRLETFIGITISVIVYFIIFII